MQVQNLSMYRLRKAYGMNTRDDAMIDAYLQRRHEASNRRISAEYRFHNPADPIVVVEA